MDTTEFIARQTARRALTEAEDYGFLTLTPRDRHEFIDKLADSIKAALIEMPSHLRLK